MMAAAGGCWVVAVTWSNDDDETAAVLFCWCCCCAGCSIIPAADALDAGRGLKRTEEDIADTIASVERVLCRTGTSMVAGGSAVLFGGYGFEILLELFAKYRRHAFGPAQPLSRAGEKMRGQKKTRDGITVQP